MEHNLVDEFSPTIVNEEPLDKQVVRLMEMSCFATTAYNMEIPNFLSTVLPVANEYLSKVTNCSLDEAIQTENFVNDERLKDFIWIISQAAWEILNRQGYAMDNFTTITHEMWCQNYLKYSGMEQHIHSTGCQISGFYFLECPKDPPKIVVYDPRPAKVYASLPEKNTNNMTNASQAVHFIPSPGQLILTNSWLPHSINKNLSDEPFKFIHFNISAVYKPSQSTDNVVVSSEATVI